MDWQELIIALISFISGGGLLGLFTLRQSKESKQIDNAAALVKEYRELLDSYKSAADEAKKNEEEARQKIEALTKKVNGLQVQMTALNERLTMYQMRLQGAELLKCDRINCMQRRPPLDKEGMDKFLSDTNAEVETTVKKGKYESE